MKVKGSLEPGLELGLERHSLERHDILKDLMVQSRAQA